MCADGLATAVESIDDGSDVFNEEDMNNVDGFTDEIETSDDDTVQNYDNELELLSELDDEFEFEVSEEGAFGTLQWIESNGVLTITGKGVIEIDDEQLPWLDNPGEITEVIICDGITGIGPGAFYGCYNLSKVTIADSVTEIAEDAFGGCSRLTDITLPEELTSIECQAFSGCTSLASIVIPEKVSFIAAYAFEACSALRKVQFNCSTVRIEDDAFNGTAGLVFVCDEASDALTYAKDHDISYIDNNDYQKIADVVVRMYQTCLDRLPDDKGIQYWIDQLITGKSTGAQMAAGFIFSNESINKNLCNSCFIDQLYRCFFGRDADITGKQYWLARMNHGKTRAEILAGFSESREFKKLCDEAGIPVGSGVWSGDIGNSEGECTVCGASNTLALEFVERMYVTCLDRESDSTGRAYWSNQIKDGRTGEYIALGFLTSHEVERKNLSNDEFVETCYKAYFGRKADPTGKKYWLHKLSKGERREKIVSGFAESSEFASLCNRYGIKAR